MPFQSGKSYGTRKRTGTYSRKNRSAASRNKASILRRKSAGAQQRQIMSLQRQVTAVKQKAKDRAMYAQFYAPPAGGAGVGSSEIPLANGEFYVNNLVRPNDWLPLFQTNAEAVDSNKARLLNCDLQLIFSPKNSLTALTPRIVRVWIVSLRKETAAKTLSQTAQMSSTGLNAAANGIFYWNTFTDGGLPTMVKLNPSCFKIHRYREFTVANIVQETAVADEDTGITNTGNALKRVRMKIPTGNFLKAATGVWKNLTEGQVEHTDRKYLLVHTGGWANDGDNQVIMDSNIVHLTRVTN